MRAALSGFLALGLLAAAPAVAGDATSGEPGGSSKETPEEAAPASQPQAGGESHPPAAGNRPAASKSPRSSPAQTGSRAPGAKAPGGKPAQPTAGGTRASTSTAKTGSARGTSSGAASKRAGASPSKTAAPPTPASKSKRSAMARSSTPKKESDRGAAPLYTNEDLKKYADPSDSAVDPALLKRAREDEEAFEKDAAKKQEKVREEAASRDKSLKYFEDRYNEAVQKLDKLRQLANNDANPGFLPPQIDDDKENEARKDLDAKQRYERTLEQIKAAEAEVEQARKNLEESREKLKPRS